MADQPTSHPRKKLYIETVGCQMNVLDSELVVARLRDDGYELTTDIEEADAILYNTCSVRQHAEDKIYSALGRIKQLKKRKPELSIGVLGCMAQKDQNLILKRAPHVDIVVGPGQLARVPELLTIAKAEAKPQLAVSLARTAGSRDDVTSSFDNYDSDREPSVRPSPFQAYLRVMMGCDKFCTYCIVPSVRGPEQSRPPDGIVAEARALAGQGVKEITLIGQTVNSYKFREPDGRTTRLSDLLARLHDVEGVERIKFITNFPNDMTDDLLQAVRDLPKVSRYIHVPAQSGCDLVLKRMKRMYTVGFYEDMLARLRETIPGSSVSSDFIVGFCGETDESFQKTVGLVERSRFKNSFIFKYSPRTGTKADDLFADDVPEEVKKRRNHELLELQTAISLEDNMEFVGRETTVLVEGRSRSTTRREGWDGVDQLSGRTHCDRIVVFDGPERLIGRMVQVRIENASGVTLFGQVVTAERIASSV
ncbi:MAG: tRNA (N6-isopentenyl adenosine(37)-C2)-methylthiotransferase MiaB [Paludisphaera borealis]|uniref:tRNA (N6-isopentenyl adenosine(37)-C2)-methylthiotransferase MiaB n=1 Tax=Paludisphaera borealis TaxID=1387353 RepID=UPI00283B2C12|nr:tRNA (N6-isopentenyl adenosine(37)-C2)-methylthiotransferase MiaB [Paludisphaera borealis]MDR3618183.1 tRNA (N6-isopentenyl adenosine(37)-C2)-methylthiotransferase MiaB [Paludisphaera borealis]